MENLTALNQFLETPKRLVLTTHHKPDGDALGSMLGLGHYLGSLGHHINFLSPSDFPSFLDFLYGTHLILDGSNNTEQAEKILQQADLLICLDFNRLERTYAIESILKNNPKPTFMIDHHLFPEGFHHYSFYDPKASSTAELVYRFILERDSAHLITPEIANCLYTGILTDTGSFQYRSTTPFVHRAIADLLEKGADIQQVFNEIYCNYPLNRTQFLGYCLYNKLVVLPDFKTAYMAISTDELREFDIKTGDTEGLVNYALGIQGINFASLIIDRKELVKISFRSVGKFSAQQFALHFDGGGHFNAAGGKSSLSLEQTVQKFLSILPDYREQLNY